MGIGTRESAIAIGFTFPIIGASLIALRFYIRWHQKSSVGIDDWLCLPSWLFLTGCCASLLTGTYKNAFVTQPLAYPDDVPEQQHILAQVTGAIIILWITSNASIKLSILFFYRRIFVGKIFKICNWALIGSSILWFIYSFLSWMLFCGTDIHANFEGGWAACDPWGFDLQIGVFCLDSVIDACLLVLPIPFVWKLKLPLLRKLIILAIFVLGGFAFVAGLMNTKVQVVSLTHREIVDTGEKTDFFQAENYLKSSSLIYCWPSVEIGVGLIACNLPSLSFRAAQALPKKIRQGWKFSLSKLRYAADILPLRLDSKRSRHETQLTSDEEDATALEWYGSRRRPPKIPEQDASVATVSQIPLTHVRPKGNANDEPRSMENGNGEIIQGFDAV